MIQVQEFFDPATYTLTYVVWDPQTNDAIVIDPVLDYEPAASQVSEVSVRAVDVFLRERALKLHLILETHAHADHLSGSQVLKRYHPAAKIGIGARITEVQAVFKKVFGLPENFRTDGSQFDRLFLDEEKVVAGSLHFQVLFTPGHTPACVCYWFEGAVFTGDTLFMPDYGVGRCDFPLGSAEALYQSVQQRLYRLPEDTRVFTGHDYQPGGRQLRFASTVREQKQSNVQLCAETRPAEFVAFRTARDKSLAAPKLLLPSVQVNIDAGRLPSANESGKRFLKIPISVA